MNGMERFGVALRRHRTARKLSQEELADLAGMGKSGRTHVNRIETGEIQRPSDATIEKLSAALGVSSEELLRTVEPPLEERAWYVPDIDADELVALYNRLPEPDRVRLVAIARTLWQVSESG